MRLKFYLPTIQFNHCIHFITHNTEILNHHFKPVRNARNRNWILEHLMNSNSIWWASIIIYVKTEKQYAQIKLSKSWKTFCPSDNYWNKLITVKSKTAHCSQDFDWFSCCRCKVKIVDSVFRFTHSINSTRKSLAIQTETKTIFFVESTEESTNFRAKLIRN